MALVILVLLGYGFAQLAIWQKSEPGYLCDVLSTLNLNETQLEKQDSDSIESSDHFEEIEEFYFFSFVSLKLQISALFNQTSSEFAYKKHLAYCCARDPPASSSRYI